MVAAIEKDFIPVLLDFDTETVLAREHGVENTPMIQWTDSEGEVMATTELVQPADRILEDMATTLEFLDEDM